MRQDLVPDHFLILIKQLYFRKITQNSHHMQEILLIGYFKGLLKALKTFLLKTSSVPFNGQDYKKQKIPGTEKSLFRSQNKLRKIHLLVMYSPVPNVLNNSPPLFIDFWIFCQSPLSYLDPPPFQRLLKWIVRFTKL